MIKILHEIDTLSPFHQCIRQICRFYKWHGMFSESIQGLLLQRATLEGVEYTNYPHEAGVIGFVDGVDFAICKPKQPGLESTFYSGHKKMHCVIHQGLSSQTRLSRMLPCTVSMTKQRHWYLGQDWDPQGADPVEPSSRN